MSRYWISSEDSDWWGRRMRWLLNGLYATILVLTLPVWLWRAWRQPAFRRSCQARLLGPTCLVRHSATTNRHCSGRPVVWCHAVSVGEVLALKPLVQRWEAEPVAPRFVVTVATAAGLELATQLFPQAVVSQAPIDFSWAVDRIFQQVQPDLLVLVELEIWPNLLLTARRRQVPVALVNGRLSRRSFRGYRWLAPLLQPALRAVVWWGVQTAEYAERWRSLLPPKTPIAVTGSLKYDGANVDRSHPKIAELSRLLGFQTDDVVWVAGSTQPEEEVWVWDTFLRLYADFPKLRLVLVPRHPERFESVAAWLQERAKLAQVSWQRRSRLGLADSSQPVHKEPTKPEPMEPKTPQVTLLDTVGELRWLWGRADLGFVGGSLTRRRGGQSMIEPAALGVPTCFGPYTRNFKETVDQLLLRQAAIQLRGPEELQPTLAHWLQQPFAAKRLGENAKSFIISQQGAVHRTLAALQPLFPPHPAARRSA